MDQDARLALMIEEYKTLRDEIARFQNQQKQSLMAGLGAIAVTLFAGIQQNGGAGFVYRPYLLLLLPLVLSPIGILYFETERSIFRAGGYLGIHLKKSAESLYSPLNGIWDWENYRASEKLEGQKIENYGWSKWILFLWPSPICLIAFGAVCFFVRWPIMTEVEFFGHLLLLLVDLGLIYVLFRYYRKADRMWKALDDALCPAASEMAMPAQI